MRLLAISGSARAASTNTALLRALRDHAPDDISILIDDTVQSLPVFSPDLEADLPQSVKRFFRVLDDVDGVIISSPEYVRSIPGGLKNAIDWLVSGDIIISKPVALVHASHRGDEMLENLRVVLETVTTNFSHDIFMRFGLVSMSVTQIGDTLSEPENRGKITVYLSAFSDFCRKCKAES